MTTKTNTELKIRSFESQILYFNGMYKLPIAPYPTLGVVNKYSSIFHRLGAFKITLLEEIAEMDDITSKLPIDLEPEAELDTLTELADLLGDIIIYCASEMAKFGIPLNKTLDIIMRSNFSKLAADGTVIYNDMGKVMKGPNYYKPEPELKIMLEEEIKNATTTSPGLEKGDVL